MIFVFNKWRVLLTVSKTEKVQTFSDFEIVKTSLQLSITKTIICGNYFKIQNKYIWFVVFTNI